MMLTNPYEPPQEGPAEDGEPPGWAKALVIGLKISPVLAWAAVVAILSSLALMRYMLPR